jgi:hypothetical protein
VTCLDCGKEFEYDWKNMKVAEVRPQALRGAVVPIRIGRAQRLWNRIRRRA